MASCLNTVQTLPQANKLCKAFGIKTSANAQVVLLARNAGFDSVFIDLEHAWLSLSEASNLCIVALLSGISPFVRVPHQCGNGFVQRVLDGGAMGVIFPHIHSASDAKAAVRISKYPPLGIRSFTGQQPLFGMRPTPPDQTVRVCNTSGSTVFAMIESREAVDVIDEIAGVEGVDVILVGSADLTMDLGIPLQFTSEEYQSALTKVSSACRRHGKVFGVAGVYDVPKVQDWIINVLGARFMLVQQDVSLIARGAQRAVDMLPAVGPLSGDSLHS